MTTKLTTDATKQQEIDHLTRFVESCGAGTYLSGLFTQPFMTWVEEQIKNDFPPDVFEHYQQAHIDRSMALVSKAKAEAEVKAAHQQNKELSDRHETAMQQAEAEVKYQRERVDGQQETIRYLQNTIADLNGEIDRAVEDHKALEQTIVELKAKLYDLITAK